MSFAALVLLVLATLPVNGQAVPEPDPPGQSRTIALSSVDTSRLTPDLAAVLPGLVTAALESGGVYRVIPPDETGAEAPATPVAWRLEITVSGKGPWRLAARATRVGEGGAGGRVRTKKHPFASRADLVSAIDAVASALEAGMTAADPAPEAAGGTVPLHQALSASDEAVDAYLEALTAFRSEDVPRGIGLLDEALSRDPGFTLAEAERVWARSCVDASFPAPRLQPAEGGSPAARETTHSLITGVRLALDDLAAGDPARAMQPGEVLRRRSPQAKWGRVIRGLSLAALGRLSESVEDWEAVVAADPGDPRGVMWLAAARMANGEYTQAADGFAQARRAWPDPLRLYTLEAESRARARDTDGARKVIVAMKALMTDRGLLSTADDLDPDLMLGSVELLEGHYAAALRIFKEALDKLEADGVPASATDTLHQTVIELQRDSVLSSDPLRRQREFDDTRAALDRWEKSLPAAERAEHPTRFLRLQGMIEVKEGNTVAAWKTIAAIRSMSESEGYSEFDEAYLTGATMLKEGDERGCVEAMERAAKARGRIVDLIDLGRMQLRARMMDEARATFDKAEEGLVRYTPAVGEARESLVLTDPHLAAMVPVFYYARAALAYQTGLAKESRHYFNMLLKYYRTPDDRVKVMAQEALERGAKPE